MALHYGKCLALWHFCTPGGTPPRVMALLHHLSRPAQGSRREESRERAGKRWGGQRKAEPTLTGSWFLTAF